MDLNFLPILMFVFLFLALGVGMHIAFGLYAIALGFAFFLWGGGGMNTVIMAIWGAMNNFALLAIPLFIFMAIMLEKSNLVADIYTCFYKWSGPLRGGLAVATILVGAVIGAVSGVVAAGVIGLGVIALPQMEHYKYNRGVNIGSVLAGGTLGQIIPPSLVMVIYGAVTGVSVGKLFAAGVSAGILLSCLVYPLYPYTFIFPDRFLPCTAKGITCKLEGENRFSESLDSADGTYLSLSWGNIVRHGNTNRRSRSWCLRCNNVQHSHQAVHVRYFERVPAGDIESFQHDRLDDRRCGFFRFGICGDRRQPDGP